MQMILHPFDNNVIADNYEILAELGFYKQRLGLEIRKYENPFVQTDCDNIENIHLATILLGFNLLAFVPASFTRRNCNKNRSALLHVRN